MFRGEYFHANLTFDKIIYELVSWKTNTFPDKSLADPFVRDCLECCGAALEKVSISKKAYPSLKKDIESFIKNLLSGRRVSG